MTKKTETIADFPFGPITGTPEEMAYALGVEDVPEFLKHFDALPEAGGPIDVTRFFTRRELRLSESEWLAAQDAAKKYGVDIHTFLRGAILYSINPEE